MIVNPKLIIKIILNNIVVIRVCNFVNICMRVLAISTLTNIKTKKYIYNLHHAEIAKNISFD